MSAGTQAMLRLLAMLPPSARGQMVRMYTELLAAQVRELALAVQAPDAATVALVHKLAGSAAMMQDQDLSLPARAMEKALREGRPDDARALLPEVQAAAERTLAALAAL